MVLACVASSLVLTVSSRFSTLSFDSCDTMTGSLSFSIVALARAAGVAIAVCDSADFPMIADLTADFVYARLRGTREDEPLGYLNIQLGYVLGMGTGIGLRLVH